MHAVYVIQNDVTKEIYIGHTTDLKKRLATHNARGAKHTTRMNGSWKYIYVELYRHDDDARARERRGFGRFLVEPGHHAFLSLNRATEYTRRHKVFYLLHLKSQYFSVLLFLKFLRIHLLHLSYPFLELNQLILPAFCLS